MSDVHGKTIRAIARMGLWVLHQVDDLNDLVGSCERCSTPIRYVYHLQSDDGQECAVGSTCGPLVCSVSAQEWRGLESRFEAISTLQPQLEALDNYNNSAGRPLSNWWAESLEGMRTGIITQQDIKEVARRLREFEKHYVDRGLDEAQQISLLSQLLPNNEFILACRTRRMTPNMNAALTRMVRQYKRQIFDLAYSKGICAPRSCLEIK